MEKDPVANQPAFSGHGIASDQLSESFLVERFSHLLVEVTNLERSETWYRDIVGVDVLGRNLTAEERPHSLLQMNTGQLLILVQSDTVRHRLPGRSNVHHAFFVTPEQYRRVQERLKEHGYKIHDDRQRFRAKGEFSIDLTDPDGHRYQIQTQGPEATQIILPGTGVVDCGLAANYKAGDVKLFKDGNFFLVRLREGFLALSRWCVHMNGLVIWQEAHWRFACPFHGATYDRRGNATRRPAECALRLNPITFSTDGRVMVDTDKVIQRDSYQSEHAVQAPAEAPLETTAVHSSTGSGRTV